MLLSEYAISPIKYYKFWKKLKLWTYVSWHQQKKRNGLATVNDKQNKVILFIRLKYLISNYSTPHYKEMKWVNDLKKDSKLWVNIHSKEIIIHQHPIALKGCDLISSWKRKFVNKYDIIILLSLYNFNIAFCLAKP